MSEPLTVRVIEDASGWDAIRAQWDALYRVSPSASTPLDFVWLRCWWQVYGPVYGEGGLRIITLWRGGTMVGALPLYLQIQRAGLLSVRCLRFLSTGEAEHEETCPDYLDLLHLPDEDVICAQAAWAAIEGMGWDTLELLDLPHDSPLKKTGERMPGLKVSSRGSCPIANIDGGMEAYLKRLSSKTRMRARQEMRKAEQSEAVMQLAGADDAAGYFDDLVRLHQARWKAEGKPGCFAAPRFTAFHRSLLQDWFASGRLVLARLARHGEAHVVLYGFITGDKFDLYQLGVGSMDGSVIHSPGTASNLLLMSALADRGVTRYDFLRGESAFKKSLTSEVCGLVALHHVRRNLRTMQNYAIHFIRRAARKVIRTVMRR